MSPVGALSLATAMTLLMSPHYAWYFAWLAPFLVLVPSPCLIWLTAAAAFFEPVEWPDDFALVSAIYIPFLVLVSLEAAWHIARVRRMSHGEPAGLQPVDPRRAQGPSQKSATDAGRFER